MLISPNTVNINHKKFDTLPPGALLSYPQQSYDETIEVSGPSWLTFYDITHSSLKVKLNSGVDAIPAGTYNEEGKVQIFIDDIGHTLVLGIFTINLNLEDTILLNVAPNSAAFNFEIGGATPVNKIIQVTSENAWTVAKNAAWLSLSATNGNNNGTFEIGVVTTGLAAGVYSDNVTVDDGGTPKTIAVQLTVTNANTGTDYLFVNPQLVKFGYSSGGTIPPQKNIELNASANWTATADQSWISLPTASGSSGAAIVSIALQNVSGLAIGDHFANVTYTVGSINKTVVVQLSVYEFVTELLTEGDLHFCDDDNTIKVSSSRLDTFLKYAFSTVYKSVSYFMEAKVPYFKGTAQKRIGMRPKKIIGTSLFSQFVDPSLFEPYPVLSLNIAISELMLFTETTIQTQNLNNLKFIKGTTPNSRKLCSLADKVYVTKNAVLWFSVLTDGLTVNSINVSGQHSYSYAFPPITKDFLTAVLPLSNIGTLNVGDQFKISILSSEVEVVIIPEGVDYTTVWFANEWGIWESLEFTGAVQVSDGFSRISGLFKKNDLQNETKIIDVTKSLEINVNTGELQSDNDVLRISKMLASSEVYIQVKELNEVVKVRPTSTKLPKYLTDQESRSFNLTFKNVIE